MNTLRRRLRTLEALVLLFAWAVAIRILPIRYTLPAEGNDHNVQRVTESPSQSKTALAIRGAIRSAVARLPFRPTCLAQSLAAGTMLSWRSVPHRFHIGVRQQENFEAHAWVEAAGLIVAGEGAVDSYSVMLSREN